MRYYDERPLDPRGRPYRNGVALPEGRARGAGVMSAPRIDWRAVWTELYGGDPETCGPDQYRAADHARIEQLVEQQFFSQEVMPAHQAPETASPLTTGGKPAGEGTPALCPHCGKSEAVECCDADEALGGRRRARMQFVVVCSVLRYGCGASGGVRYTEAEAIAAWNSRAPLAHELLRRHERPAPAIDELALLRDEAWPGHDDDGPRVHGDSAERDAGYDANEDPLHPLIGEGRR